MATMTGEEKGNYSASNIQVLEGLEAVRKRPGMYIGDTESAGLHHLVYEVVDNSIDEALAGHCTEISVKILKDNSIVVEDNGRGIPTDIHSHEKGRAISGLEIALTKLHAGGKFDKDTYKVSGGLHGVGVSCVNALSFNLEVDVWRGNTHYYMRFARGVPQTELENRGAANKRGTRVHFNPDPEIFSQDKVSIPEYDAAILTKRLRELAFLNSGISITFCDERDETNETIVFAYAGGLRSFVKYLNEGKETLFPEPTDPIYFKETMEDPQDKTTVELEVAMQWNKSYDETIVSFVNNITTRGGGTHLQGFSAALTHTLNNYYKREQEGKKKSAETTLGGEDFREGLCAVLSVKVAEPQFRGQTKDELGNKGVLQVARTLVTEKLDKYLDEHPKLAKLILEKAEQAFAAREAARKAKSLSRKTALDRNSLPGKLTDCLSRDPEKTELFIVEGDSAGGSAKGGRDRATQAILPIRGKILNVEKARLDKILQNTEVGAMVAALGCGIGMSFDLSKLRYHKVIIMTDADVDGSHIRTLLLTFFFRHMPALIKHGHVYIAQPPLFKVSQKKSERYIMSEAGMDSYLLELGIKDLSVRFTGKETPISGSELEELIGFILEIEKFKHSVELKGMPFKEFLATQNEEGHYLRYKIDVAGEDFLAYSDEERETIIRNDKQSQEEAHNQLIANLSEEEKVNRRFTYQPCRCITLYAEESFNALLRNLLRFNLSLKDYFGSGDKLFDVIDQKSGEVLSNGEIFSLKEGIALFRESGRKGTDIQRYKGLGEMNADQLAETTMETSKRTLVQVTIPDEDLARHTVSMLMGDDVPPRKHFIESRALSVTNLDI